jgi:hypothetical protein
LTAAARKEKKESKDGEYSVADWDCREKMRAL